MDQGCPSHYRIAKAHSSYLPQLHGPSYDGVRNAQNICGIKEFIKILTFPFNQVVISKNFDPANR